MWPETVHFIPAASPCKGGNRRRDEGLADKVTLQHRAEYAGFRLGMAGVRLLPEAGASRVAARLARLGHGLGVKRGVVESNLRLAFPEKDEAWVRETARESYAHLGREMLMMLRLSWTSPEEVVARSRVINEAPARAAYEAGRGVMVVTGHLGNWEIGGAAVAARGYEVSAVAKRAANPLFYQRVMAARERFGVEIIDFQQATKRALKALREGRVVALAADQHASAGIWVPFFGRPAATFRGPAVMSLRTGAPMFLATCTRAPDGIYEVVLHHVDTTPTDDMEADVRRVTEGWVRRLEEAVRARPGQYLWHHRRWREPPPGALQEQGHASTV
jgi:Kdo2-lipid IVA lauroyltransferase/acyltransferase